MRDSRGEFPGGPAEIEPIPLDTLTSHGCAEGAGPPAEPVPVGNDKTGWRTSDSSTQHKHSAAVEVLADLSYR